MTIRIFSKISLFFILCLFVAASSSTALGQRVRTPEKNDKEKAQLVEKAFGAVRHKDFQYKNELDKLGKKIIPYLEPYLFDENSLVKGEVLGYLKQYDTPESVHLLAKMLENAATFDGTADVVYESFKSSSITKHPEIRRAVLKSLSEGGRSLTGILLLSNFADEDVADALRSVAIIGGEETEKLPSLFLSLRYSLAANFALTLIGNADGTSDFLSQIETASIDETFFLLNRLDCIKNKTVLLKMKNIFLKDERVFKTAQGEMIVKKPDGTLEYQMPQIRLRDLAVEFFVTEFKIKTSFDIDEKKMFTDAEIAETDRKIEAYLIKK